MDAPHPWTHSLRRAATFLRPHRAAMAAILFTALCLAGMGAVEPLLFKRIFDGLGTQRALPLMVTSVLGLLALALLRELGNATSSWLTWRTRLRLQYALNKATVERLHSLPISFHRAEGVGALMTRLDRGIQGFVTAVTEVGFGVLPSAVYLVIALVIMFRLEWRLALVLTVFAPLPALLAQRAAREQVSRERELMDRWVKIYARFNEVLSGILTVKSFAMERREGARFLTDVEQANARVVEGVRTDALVTAAQNGVVALARISAVAFGGWLIASGKLTVGSLVAFLSYVGGLFSPVQGLSSVYRTLRTASVSLDHVFDILDAPDHLEDAPDAQPAPRLSGRVDFEHVEFGYGERSILRGLDLSVRAGERVALVGTSGAGKSTLMALLCRFYDVREGAVKVDGHDVRALQQVSLREQIGVVLQDALLFNESVRENIAYGRPGASMEEIVAAAKAAHAHEFICTLPQGYDTPVGERGGRLSMGERQRIAIARALLKDPPVLILDEPTSALDAESESLIQEALLRLTHGRTTFAIAHRLSTVVDADRILVLDQGRIVESGSHAELMARDGFYAALVRKQTQGLLPSDLPRPPPAPAALAQAS